MSIFCMCGAQASYPHDPACPYPLFHGTDFQIGEWEKLYQNKKAGLTAPSALPDDIIPPSMEEYDDGRFGLGGKAGLSWEELAPQPPSMMEE